VETAADAAGQIGEVALSADVVRSATTRLRRTTLRVTA